MMEKDEKIYESKITHILDKNVILAITISILITYFMGGNISYIIIGIIVLLSLYILTFKKIRIVVRNNELVYNYKKNNEIFNFDMYRFKAIVRGERRQYRLEATNENGDVKLINCNYLGWKKFKELINELKIDIEYIN